MARGYYKEVTTILKANGCTFERQASGSHEIWHSPINNLRFTVSFTVKSRHTANEILKQAGLSKAF